MFLKPGRDLRSSLHQTEDARRGQEGQNTGLAETLIAWLIAAGEITPGLVEIGRDHVAGQVTKAIDVPSSGAVYEKVQGLHAIMSELMRALPKIGHSRTT
jgi:hypothetical protein